MRLRTPCRRHGHLVLRHALLCLGFIPVSLLLSLPDVILPARLGSVVWYPATAVAMALIVAVSPWYLLLTCIADTLASLLFYHFATWLELAAQGRAELLTPFIIFGPRWAHLQLYYLSFIPIIWIATRLGSKDSVTGLLVLNFGVVLP